MRVRSLPWIGKVLDRERATQLERITHGLYGTRVLHTETVLPPDFVPVGRCHSSSPSNQPTHEEDRHRLVTEHAELEHLLGHSMSGRSARAVMSSRKSGTPPSMCDARINRTWREQSLIRLMCLALTLTLAFAALAFATVELTLTRALAALTLIVTHKRMFSG